MDKKAIEHLATKVIGFKIDYGRSIRDEAAYYRDDPPIIRIDVNRFNPFENIEQAMMLLRAWGKGYQLIHRARGEYHCILPKFDNEGYWVGNFKSDLQQTECEAICNAVLQATGYEDSQP